MSKDFTLAKETYRTYYFGKDKSVQIPNVTKVAVSDSGTHYLEQEGGGKYIIPPSWIALEIEADTWEAGPLANGN